MPQYGSIKRSVTINGHRTSITLEPEFWAALKTIANEDNQSIGSLIARIDRQQHENLSSAVRVFVLTYYQTRASHL